MRGFKTESGQGHGQGAGAGGGGRPAGGGLGRMGGGGMGSGGFCVCAKCGRRIPHRRGKQCAEDRCPDCGVALVREGSEHHRKIEMPRKQTGGEND